MDKIELAREMLQVLEGRDVGQAAEVARRAFCIQDRLETF